jgi:hypothetical protein
MSDKGYENRPVVTLNDGWENQIADWAKRSNPDAVRGFFNQIGLSGILGDNVSASNQSGSTTAVPTTPKDPTAVPTTPKDPTAVPTTPKDPTAGTTDARNTAVALYTDLLNTVMNNDPTKTDWGKTILDYYGIKSLSDANGVRGSGAADNAGNVDSYAAANAARQRLSTLNQGVNAVMSESQNRNAAALNTLSSLGVDVTGILGAEATNLGNYYDHDASLYKSDTTLEGVKDTNKTNKEIAEMGASGSSVEYQAMEDDYPKNLADVTVYQHPDWTKDEVVAYMAKIFQEDYGMKSYDAYMKAVEGFDALGL